MKNPGITFSRHAGTNVIVVPPDFYRKEKADIPHRNICHQSVSYPGTENCKICSRYPYPLTLEHGLSYLQSVRLASHKPIPKEASYCLPPALCDVTPDVLSLIIDFRMFILIGLKLAQVKGSVNYQFQFLCKENAPSPDAFSDSLCYVPKLFSKYSLVVCLEFCDTLIG